MAMRFEPSDWPTVGYLYLSKHPGTAGCVKGMIHVREFIPNYVGPDIHLDLDASGEVIGIEVLEKGPLTADS
jgi:uncharacterized protein YuzE